MKKISLFLSLIFAVFAYAQETLVQYRFDNNLNPDAGAIGSPNLTLANASIFSYVPGNSGQALALDVIKKENGVNYFRIQISTTGYRNISLSFDGYNTNNGGNQGWRIFANTDGSVPDFNTAGLGTSWHTSTWLSYNLALTGLGNSSLVTVFIAAVNTAANTPQIQIDNLKITGCKMPPAPGAAAQTFCYGAAVSGLVATKDLPSNTLNWYNSATSTTALAGTELLSSATYYVSQTNACGAESLRTAVNVTVNPNLPASVSIAATPGTTVCTGTAVTFTATPVNGGTAPQYQWQRNGVSIPGASASTYNTSSLVNGDMISVIMTSNASPCLTGSPAASNIITMTVNPEVSAGTVTFSNNTVCTGSSSSASSNGNSGGSWSSSNTTVATVNSSGVVTALSAGTATITYTLSSGCGAPKSSSAVITVNPNVTAGSISYTSNSLCVGSTATYSTTGNTGGTWSSSNTGVATVSATGVVTAVSAGNAIITYTINSGCGSPQTASAAVTVNALPSATVSVSGSNRICSNTTAAFTISGTAGDTVTYNINGGEATVITIPAGGSSQVIISDATANQTVTVLSVSNGTCVNPAGSSATVTVGATSTYSAGNWSNGLPNNNGLNAVIASDYDTQAGSISACNCTVNSGATLTVSPDTFVEVLNDVTNNGKLIVKSDGNLKQINAVTNTTPITVRRLHTLTSARKEYNFLSSPVENQNMKTIYGNNAANVAFVMVLRESTNSFVTATSADYAVKGKGFGVKEPVVNYTDLSGDSLPVNEAQYKGIPNNGNIALAFPTHTTGRGYNLVGNPYPSNMDIMDLYSNSTKSLLDPTFRFWDNMVNDIYVQQGGAYQGYSYALYNAETDTDGFGVAAPGNNTGGPTGTKVPTRVIKATQGFMVRSTGPGAQLNFNNSMRRTSNTDTVFFGKSSTKNRYRLQLVRADGFTIQNGISYFEAGSSDFGREDSRIPNASASDALFTFAGDAKVVINGRSNFRNDDVITLGLRHFTAGTFKLQVIDKEGVFATGQPVYLKDKKLGIITDLAAADYRFAAEAGEFTNRFEIVYHEDVKLSTSGVTTDGSTVEIYRDGIHFVVKSKERTIEYLELYDAAGRLITTLGGNTKELRFNAESLLNGMYVLKAGLKGGEQVTRKIRK